MIPQCGGRAGSGPEIGPSHESRWVCDDSQGVQEKPTSDAYHEAQDEQDQFDQPHEADKQLFRGLLEIVDIDRIAPDVDGPPAQRTSGDHATTRSSVSTLLEIHPLDPNV
jgi:hypothetical protein